jgi:hypothetical protein
MRNYNLKGKFGTHRILRSQFASSDSGINFLRSQNVTLNKDQIEYIYDENIHKDNFKLSHFVIPFTISKFGGRNLRPPIMNIIV